MRFINKNDSNLFGLKSADLSSKEFISTLPPWCINSFLPKLIPT